jgi:hypothetical protein
MLALLGEQLGVDLMPGRVEIEGSWVQVDGVCQNPPILVEAWAHHGIVKPAQRNKVSADILKLATAAESFGVRPRLILLFADETAAAEVTGRSWRATACRHHGVEVVVVEIPEDLKQSILEAQATQYR